MSPCLIALPTCGGGIKGGGGSAFPARQRYRVFGVAEGVGRRELLEEPALEDLLAAIGDDDLRGRVVRLGRRRRDVKPLHHEGRDELQDLHVELRAGDVLARADRYRVVLLRLLVLVLDRDLY